MGRLFRFPKLPLGEAPDRDYHDLDNPPIRTLPVEQKPECDGIMHVFTGVPGRCQCGETTWDTMPPEQIGIHHVA